MVATDFAKGTQRSAKSPIPNTAALKPVEPNFLFSNLINCCGSIPKPGRQRQLPRSGAGVGAEPRSREQNSSPLESEIQSWSRKKASNGIVKDNAMSGP